MRQQALVSLVAALTALPAYAQTDEWRLRMDEGAVADNAGDYLRAAAAYRDATAIAERLDRTDRRRAVTWNSMGSVYAWLGRFVDAETAYRRALGAAEQAEGKSSPSYAWVLSNLGTLYVDTGQVARGEKLLRQSLAIQSASDKADEVRIAIVQNALAQVLATGGKYRDAERLLLSSLTVLENHASQRTEAALARNNLGVVRYYQKSYVDAERHLVQALAVLEQELGPDHPMLVRVLNNLAALAGRTRRFEEAGQRLSRAIDIVERRLGPDHPMCGSLLSNYAACLRQSGDKSRAKTLQARANQILSDSSRRNGTGAVIDISALQHK